MKRRRLSYDEWGKVIEEKSLEVKFVKESLLTGHIGKFDIIKVIEPQTWHFNGEDIVVCQDGYRWLSILPNNEYFCITAMLNKESEIVLWYIDMIAEQGIDSDGIPYFYDLYLDLVVYPDGVIVEDDMDELEDALKQGDIAPEQFQLALDTSKRLKQGLLVDVDKFAEFTLACMKLIRNNEY